MKILFITNNVPPQSEAAVTRVPKCSARLAAWGHDVTLLITHCPDEGGGSSGPVTEMLDGVRVIRIKTQSGGRLLRALASLRFILMASLGASMSRPEIMVATSPPLFTAVAGWLLGCRFRRSFVLELGDTGPGSILTDREAQANLGRRLMARLEFALYGRADAVTTVKRSFKARLVEHGIPASKIAVLNDRDDLSGDMCQRQAEEMLQVLEIVKATWGIQVGEPDDVERK